MMFEREADTYAIYIHIFSLRDIRLFGVGITPRNLLMENSVLVLAEEVVSFYAFKRVLRLSIHICASCRWE